MRKTDAPLRNKIVATRNKTCPAPRSKVATSDIGMVRKTHVATYFGEYFTIMSARGLELYDKSEPQRLVCIYPGEKFIIDSSDDDLEIYRF